MGKLTVAVAGLGRIGKIHLKNLCADQESVHVAGVMDADPLTKAYADSLGVNSFTQSFGDLLKIPGLDAVIICSPTNTHADYVTQGIRAGKHIFCEKPLDLSLLRVKEVLKLAEDSKNKLMLGFNRRFDPEFRKIHDLVKAGAIGDPRIVKITSRDPGPPPGSYIKSSGGLFLDMTIHDFDMARYISGKQVKEVFARGTVMVDKAIGDAGDIDTAIVTLTFEDHTMAVIDNCRKASYGYDQRLEVFGDRGMLTTDNMFKDYHRLYTREGTSGSLPLDFFMDRYAQSYILEMKEFVNSVSGNKPVPAGGNDGLMSLVIGLAAKISVTENRLVKLSEIH